MLKFFVSAALLTTAASALAQAPAAAPAAPPPAQQAAVQTAGQAFGQCLASHAGAVPATVTPEAGADTMLAACSTQRQALLSAVNALVATLPAEQRAAAQQQIQSELGDAALRTRIAAHIQQDRAAATAPATAAPAPSGH